MSTLQDRINAARAQGAAVNGAGNPPAFQAPAAAAPVFNPQAPAGFAPPPPALQPPAAPVAFAVSAAAPAQGYTPEQIAAMTAPTPTVAPFPPGAPAPAFAAPGQINPPEAAQPFPPPQAPAPMAVAPAAPAAPVAVADGKRRGRPRKADTSAPAAAGTASAPLATSLPVVADAEPPFWTVTLCVSSSDGTRIEVPAAPELADAVIDQVAQRARALLGAAISAGVALSGFVCFAVTLFDRRP